MRSARHLQVHLALAALVLAFAGYAAAALSTDSSHLQATKCTTQATSPTPKGAVCDARKLLGSPRIIFSIDVSNSTTSLQDTAPCRTQCYTFGGCQSFGLVHDPHKNQPRYDCILYNDTIAAMKPYTFGEPIKNSVLYDLACFRSNCPATTTTSFSLAPQPTSTCSYTLAPNPRRTCGNADPPENRVPFQEFYTANDLAYCATACVLLPSRCLTFGWNFILGICQLLNTTIPAYNASNPPGHVPYGQVYYARHCYRNSCGCIPVRPTRAYTISANTATCLPQATQLLSDPGFESQSGHAPWSFGGAAGRPEIVHDDQQGADTGTSYLQYNLDTFDSTYARQTLHNLQPHVQYLLSYRFRVVNHNLPEFCKPGSQSLCYPVCSLNTKVVGNINAQDFDRVWPSYGNVFTSTNHSQNVIREDFYRTGYAAFRINTTSTTVEFNATCIRPKNVTAMHHSPFVMDIDTLQFDYASANTCNFTIQMRSNVSTIDGYYLFQGKSPFYPTQLVATPKQTEALVFQRYKNGLLLNLDFSFYQAHQVPYVLSSDTLVGLTFFGFESSNNTLGYEDSLIYCDMASSGALNCTADTFSLVGVQPLYYYCAQCTETPPPYGTLGLALTDPNHEQDFVKKGCWKVELFAQFI